MASSATPPATQNVSHSESFRGFGKFLIQVADQLNLKILIQLTKLFQLPPAFSDELNKAKNPGLCFLEKLIDRGKLSNTSIRDLTEALVSIDCGGIAESVKYYAKENDLKIEDTTDEK